MTKSCVCTYQHSYGCQLSTPFFSLRACFLGLFPKHQDSEEVGERNRKESEHKLKNCCLSGVLGQACLKPAFKWKSAKSSLIPQNHLGSERSLPSESVVDCLPFNPLQMDSLSNGSSNSGWRINLRTLLQLYHQRSEISP